MNALAFLDDAAALEEILSAIYEMLAGLTADAEMKKDLQRLRDEEIGHNRVIRTGKNYVRRAPDLFNKTIITEKELEGGLEAARSILDNIRSGDLDFKTALVHVRRLEEQFEKIHMATGIAIEDESLKTLFRQLFKDDKDHRLTLDEMIQKLA
jgi:rubrerythrin